MRGVWTIVYNSDNDLTVPATEKSFLIAWLLYVQIDL
jgi:hypothetical protein